MAIWTKPGPFICLEPWYGIADSLGFNGALKDKESIQSLEPSKIFSCAWSVEIE